MKSKYCVTFDINGEFERYMYIKADLINLDDVEIGIIIVDGVEIELKDIVMVELCDDNKCLYNLYE